MSEVLDTGDDATACQDAVSDDWSAMLKQSPNQKRAHLLRCDVGKLQKLIDCGLQEMIDYAHTMRDNGSTSGKPPFRYKPRLFVWLMELLFRFLVAPSLNKRKNRKHVANQKKMNRGKTNIERINVNDWPTAQTKIEDVAHDTLSSRACKMHLCNQFKKMGVEVLWCGATLKNKDFTFRCRDCTPDDSCVMCIKCFVHSPCRFHRNSISVTAGGVCDCGDPLAWRPESFCTRHRISAAAAVAAAQLPRSLAELSVTAYAARHASRDDTSSMQVTTTGQEGATKKCEDDASRHSSEDKNNSFVVSTQDMDVQVHSSHTSDAVDGSKKQFYMPVEDYAWCIALLRGVVQAITAAMQLVVLSEIISATVSPSESSNAKDNGNATKAAEVTQVMGTRTPQLCLDEIVPRKIVSVLERIACTAGEWPKMIYAMLWNECAPLRWADFLPRMRDSHVDSMSVTGMPRLLKLKKKASVNVTALLRCRRMTCMEVWVLLDLVVCPAPSSKISMPINNFDDDTTSYPRSQQYDYDQSTADDSDDTSSDERDAGAHVRTALKSWANACLSNALFRVTFVSGFVTYAAYVNDLYTLNTMRTNMFADGAVNEQLMQRSESMCSNSSSSRMDACRPYRHHSILHCHIHAVLHHLRRYAEAMEVFWYNEARTKKQAHEQNSNLNESQANSNTNMTSSSSIATGAMTELPRSQWTQKDYTDALHSIDRRLYVLWCHFYVLDSASESPALGNAAGDSNGPPVSLSTCERNLYTMLHQLCETTRSAMSIRAAAALSVSALEGLLRALVVLSTSCGVGFDTDTGFVIVRCAVTLDDQLIMYLWHVQDGMRLVLRHLRRAEQLSRTTQGTGVAVQDSGAFLQTTPNATATNTTPTTTRASSSSPMDVEVSIGTVCCSDPGMRCHGKVEEGLRNRQSVSCASSAMDDHDHNSGSGHNKSIRTSSTMCSNENDEQRTRPFGEYVDLSALGVHPAMMRGLMSSRALNGVDSVAPTSDGATSSSPHNYDDTEEDDDDEMNEERDSPGHEGKAHCFHSPRCPSSDTSLLVTPSPTWSSSAGTHCVFDALVQNTLCHVVCALRTVLAVQTRIYRRDKHGSSSSGGATATATDPMSSFVQPNADLISGSDEYDLLSPSRRHLVSVKPYVQRFFAMTVRAWMVESECGEVAQDMAQSRVTQDGNESTMRDGAYTSWRGCKSFRLSWRTEEPTSTRVHLTLREHVTHALSGNKEDGVSATHAVDLPALLDSLVMPLVLISQVRKGLWKHEPSNWWTNHLTFFTLLERTVFDVEHDAFMLQLITMCMSAESFSNLVLQRFSYDESQIGRTNRNSNNNNNDDGAEAKRPTRPGYDHFFRLMLTVVLDTSKTRPTPERSPSEVDRRVVKELMKDSTAKKDFLAPRSLMDRMLFYYRYKTTSLYADSTHDRTTAAATTSTSPRSENTLCSLSVDANAELQLKHMRKNLESCLHNASTNDDMRVNMGDSIAASISRVAAVDLFASGPRLRVRDTQTWHKYVNLYDVVCRDDTMEALYEAYSLTVMRERTALQAKSASSPARSDDTNNAEYNNNSNNKNEAEAKHFSTAAEDTTTTRTIRLPPPTLPWQEMHMDLIPSTRALLHTNALLHPALLVILHDVYDLMQMDVRRKERHQQRRQEQQNRRIKISVLSVDHEESSHQNEEHGHERRMSAVVCSATTLLHAVTAIYLAMCDYVDVVRVLRESRAHDNEDNNSTSNTNVSSWQLFEDYYMPSVFQCDYTPEWQGKHDDNNVRADSAGSASPRPFLPLPSLTRARSLHAKLHHHVSRSELMATVWYASAEGRSAVAGSQELSRDLISDNTHLETKDTNNNSAGHEDGLTAVQVLRWLLEYLTQQPSDSDRFSMSAMIRFIVHTTEAASREHAECVQRQQEAVRLSQIASSSSPSVTNKDNTNVIHEQEEEAPSTMGMPEQLNESAHTDKPVKTRQQRAHEKQLKLLRQMMNRDKSLLHQSTPAAVVAYDVQEDGKVPTARVADATTDSTTPPIPAAADGRLHAHNEQEQESSRTDRDCRDASDCRVGATHAARESVAEDNQTRSDSGLCIQSILLDMADVGECQVCHKKASPHAQSNPLCFIADISSSTVLQKLTDVETHNDTCVCSRKDAHSMGGDDAKGIDVSRTHTKSTKIGKEARCRCQNLNPHVNICGHCIHVGCAIRLSKMQAYQQDAISDIYGELDKIDKNELMCPLCRAIGSQLIPVPTRALLRSAESSSSSSDKDVKENAQLFGDLQNHFASQYFLTVVTDSLHKRIISAMEPVNLLWRSPIEQHIFSDWNSIFKLSAAEEDENDGVVGSNDESSFHVIKTSPRYFCPLYTISVHLRLLLERVKLSDYSSRVSSREMLKDVLAAFALLVGVNVHQLVQEEVALRSKLWAVMCDDVDLNSEPPEGNGTMPSRTDVRWWSSADAAQLRLVKPDIFFCTLLIDVLKSSKQLSGQTVTHSGSTNNVDDVVWLIHRYACDMIDAIWRESQTPGQLRSQSTLILWRELSRLALLKMMVSTEACGNDIALSFGHFSSTIDGNGNKAQRRNKEDDAAVVMRAIHPDALQTDKTLRAAVRALVKYVCHNVVDEDGMCIGETCSELLQDNVYGAAAVVLWEKIDDEEEGGGDRTRQDELAFGESVDPLLSVRHATIASRSNACQSRGLFVDPLQWMRLVLSCILFHPSFYLDVVLHRSVRPKSCVFCGEDDADGPTVCCWCRQVMCSRCPKYPVRKYLHGLRCRCKHEMRINLHRSEVIIILKGTSRRVCQAKSLYDNEMGTPQNGVLEDVRLTLNHARARRLVLTWVSWNWVMRMSDQCRLF